MRVHNPFFFKQSFYLSTEKNTSKNAANLKYIATRPGTYRGDLEPETPEAERDPKEGSIEDDFSLSNLELLPGMSSICPCVPGAMDWPTSV
jgi:hypothetical protein